MFTHLTKAIQQLSEMKSLALQRQYPLADCVDGQISIGRNKDPSPITALELKS